MGVCSLSEKWVHSILMDLPLMGKFKLQTSVGLVFNDLLVFFFFDSKKFRTKELSVLGIFIITKLEVLMKEQQ
jgi:hypothetical protein